MIIGSSQGKKSILIEAVATGKENKLIFEEDAKTFALDSNMISPVQKNAETFGDSINQLASITNYTEEMNALVERYNQMVESANSDGEVTEEEQDELDDMDKRVDALKDAVSQYDETIGEMRDLEENILENDLAIMSENFSILQE